jgi:hypothetical protein
VQPSLIVYKYSTTHTIGIYAKDAARQLQNRNFLLAYTSLRGMIETIAHFNNTITNLDNYLKNEEEPKPTAEDPYETYQGYLLGILNLVFADIHGSRFNWERAMQAKTVLMTEKQRKKKTPKEKTRTSPKPEPASIMTNIDRLDKSVKGTRSAYDLLCDFVHPNSSQRKLYVNITKTETIEDIGLPIDFYGAKDAKAEDELDYTWGLSLPVMHCIFEMMDLFLKRDEQFKKSLNVLKKHTQQYTRQAIKTFRIFTHSDPCPCGSAKTIQNCCGKKLRHLFIDSERRQALFETNR